MKNSKDNDLTDFFRSLQSLTNEMLTIKSKITEDDRAFFNQLNQIQEILIKIPEQLSDGRITDLSSIANQLESLEKTFISFYCHYCGLQSAVKLSGSFQSGDLNNEQKISTNQIVPRIPLFLIHENIYRLTQLIEYYTRLEYFRVFPFFILNDALDVINMDSNGLILISSKCLSDPEQVISQIRSCSWIMPVVVLMEEKTKELCNYPGYNGVVYEECPLETLVPVFLDGLREQTSKAKFSPGKDIK